MQKHVSRTSSFPKTLALVAAIVLLVLAVFFALEKFNVTNLTNVSSGSTSEDASGDSSEPTEEEKAAQAQSEADQKQTYLDNATKNDANSSPSDTPSTSSSSNMTVSASQDGSTITVLTQIQNVSEGDCKLTVTNGSKSTTQTAQIIYQPQFSSCAGFSVPTNSIGTGTWNISVTATPTSGSTITKSTTLEVN